MTQQRIETADMFRGIAILLVVAYHYTSRLPAAALNMAEMPSPQISFGWVGVYFFFVLSGYFIFLTLERSATSRQFLARRFSRLYPAFLAALFLLYFYQMVAPVPSAPAAHYREAIPGLKDVGLNIFLVGELGEWVNGSFWSIAAEVKFYLLAAILSAVWGAGQPFVRRFFWLAMAMAGVWLGAVAISPADQRITPASLLQLATIAPFLPFFAIGFLGRKRQEGDPTTTPYLAAAIAMGVAVLWMQSGDGDTSMTGKLILSGSFILLILAFIWFVDGRPVPHIPVISPMLASIGFLSYSWYLLHETLGFSIMSMAGPYLPSWGVALLAATATYAVAWAFAKLFEWRFRKPFEKLALLVLNTILSPFTRKAAVSGAAE